MTILDMILIVIILRLIVGINLKESPFSFIGSIFHWWKSEEIKVIA